VNRMKNYSFKLIQQLIVISILGGILMGCSSQTNVPTTTSTPTLEVDASTVVSSATATSESSVFLSPVSPITTETVSTSTPTPDPGPVPTITVPAPKDDLGVVYGQIYRLNGHPYAKTLVRLGEIIWLPGKEGVDGFASSDRFNSPQDITDAWGNFIIENVPAGSYGLAVDNPEFAESTVYVLNEVGDKLLIIDVEPGKVVNIGTVKFDFE